MSAVAPPAFRLCKPTVADNPTITRVIRQASAEYGLIADKGYTVADSNLSKLHQVYSQPGHTYWMVEYEGEVVGDDRITPLTRSESNICELQKMYFLPTIRGEGLAKELALMAMGWAQEVGFKRCYPEAAAFLKKAIALYEHLGFKHIDYVLGCTGHVGCEIRMLRKL